MKKYKNENYENVSNFFIYMCLITNALMAPHSQIWWKSFPEEMRLL